jgi:O-antigen/teichoic acid export membrane protein
MFRYGSRVQISNVASLINNDTDRLVIGGLAGVATAGLFDLGAKLANGLRLLPTLGLTAMFPVATQLAASGKRAEVTALYLRATRHLAVFSFTIGAVLVVCSRPLVSLWIGHAVPFTITTLVILASSYAVFLVSGAATMVCRAEGHPGLETRSAVLGAGLNIALVAPAILWLGPVGAPLSTAVAGVVGTGYLLWRFHRDPDRPARMLLSTLGKPLLSAASAGLVLSLAAEHLHPAGRIENALAVIVLAFSTTALALALLAATRFVDDDDRAAWQRLYNRLRRRTFTVPSVQENSC